MTGLADKSMDNLADQVRHGDKATSMFVVRQISKLRPGPISPRKIAKQIRRRDQRLEAYLNSPDDDGKSPAQPPVITSSINPPPAAASPSPVPLIACSPDLAPAQAEEKGGTPHSPEAPGTGEDEV
jgi:hypothetical protein